MSVKIGETMSEECPVNGGSPQGSILGNFLFCICSDELDRGLQDQPSILNNGPEDENSEYSPPRSTHPREDSGEQPTGVDLGLAQIVTDRPSSLGVNNIAVVADQLELCVPFERNGVVIPDTESPTRPPGPQLTLPWTEDNLKQSLQKKGMQEY